MIEDRRLPQLMYIPSVFSYRDEAKSMLLMDMLELSETLKGAIVISDADRKAILRERCIKSIARGKREREFGLRHPTTKKEKRRLMAEKLAKNNF